MSGSVLITAFSRLRPAVPGEVVRARPERAGNRGRDSLQVTRNSGPDAYFAAVHSVRQVLLHLVQGHALRRHVTVDVRRACQEVEAEVDGPRISAPGALQLQPLAFGHPPQPVLADLVVAHGVPPSRMTSPPTSPRASGVWVAQVAASLVVLILVTDDGAQVTCRSLTCLVALVIVSSR